MKTIITIIIAALVTFIYSDTVNNPFNESTLEQDLKEITKNLSKEEIAVFTDYLLIKTVNNENMSGKTYAELLAEALQQNKEQLEKQAPFSNGLNNVALENTVPNDEMFYAIELIDKKTETLGEQSYVYFHLNIKNKQDKPIQHLKGSLVFYDLFDREINSMLITSNELIGVDEVVKQVSKKKINEYLHKDILLQEKKVESLKVKFIPEQIIFAEEG